MKEPRAKRDVQQELSKLAERADFKAILQEEVERRNLVFTDVQDCVAGIYGVVSKHPHGSTATIWLNENVFTPRELVVLISFFRLQDKWGHALKWACCAR